MNKRIVKNIVACVLCFLILFGVVYAFVVWRYTTKINVVEPFVVTSDLPREVTLIQGLYNYNINVTNIYQSSFNATLYYWVTSENVTYNITPANGTTITVFSFQTVSIPISIEIMLNECETSGFIEITWAIERV